MFDYCLRTPPKIEKHVKLRNLTNISTLEPLLVNQPYVYVSQEIQKHKKQLKLHERIVSDLGDPSTRVQSPPPLPGMRQPPPPQSTTMPQMRVT